MTFCYVLLQISQTIKDAVNENVVPIFGAVMVIGAIYGAVKNWRGFNDPNGDRKEALMNFGMILLYAVIAGVVITGVAKIFTSFKVF
ncbi:hypothetical protein [Chitinophaga tropicalis]|uniref:Uncharacterized protein n=1 Tax=Chitinophaga tropicalis TaxID=2683588 RepID=A0A7K1UE06_9BACT|nr:hypothetical protein [Chitinophaga tropicalis]MVT12508.1 hypothetical protein [Chitinophaga tropicalis]